MRENIFTRGKKERKSEDGDVFNKKKSRLMLLLIYLSHWKGKGNGVCFKNTVFHTVCSECIRHSLENLLGHFMSTTNIVVR